jgi:CheY-like chemotaxis protein
MARCQPHGMWTDMRMPVVDGYEPIRERNLGTEDR